MPARSRSRVTSHIPGGNGFLYAPNNASYALADTSSPSSITLMETCDDIIGNYGGNNPFFLARETAKGGTLSGISLYTSGLNEGKPHIVMNAKRIINGNVAHVVGSFDGEQSMVNAGVARGNPNRPHINAPAFLSELRDLPRTYRSIRNLFPLLLGRKTPNWRDPAEANLLYQFGLRPIISDLLKVISLSEQIDEKFRQIAMSNKKGGLKRKRVVYNKSFMDNDGNIVAHSAWGLTVSVRRDKKTVRKAWVSTRWRYNLDGLPNPAHAGNRRKMRAILLGFSPNMTNFSYQAWEAMPWSWLVDWAVPVGNYIAARDNSLSMVLDGCVLCKHSETTASWTTRSVPQGFQFETCVATKSDKTRVLSAPSSLPTVSLPILSGNQLSILGSLAVLRARRR